MHYVELHCHSAFSFLDGASLPEELVAGGARARARGARAHRPQLASRARWSSRRPPRRSACGRSTGRRSTSTTGRHLTLLVARRARVARTSAGCSRARTRTRATIRRAGPRRPGGRRSTTLEAHAEGLVCLTGCARHGVHDEPTMRRLLRRFGRDALPRRAATPLPAPRPGAEPRPGRAGAAARGAVRGDGRRPRAHAARARALQDAFVAIREHTTLDASEPLRRGNHATCSPRRRRWPPASPTIPTRSRRPRASPTRCASTSPRTSATATRAPRTRTPTARSPSCAGARFAERYPRGHPLRVGGGRAPGGGAARSSASSACRASSSCTATCSSSRARSRSRCAVPTRRARCCRPGAAAAPRCPRSSATSPGSRTSTRSPTSSCSGASSTRRSPRCPTSTSTSRATSARS